MSPVTEHSPAKTGRHFYLVFWKLLPPPEELLLRGHQPGQAWSVQLHTPPTHVLEGTDKQITRRNKWDSLNEGER